MISSRRKFALLGLAVLSLPAMGCNSTALPPRAVAHRQGRKPVDSAREFLEQRQKAFNEVLDGFVAYRHAVIDPNKGITNREIVWAYEVMNLEATHPAPRAVSAFVDSPEGSYLSAQDKEFLERLERRYHQQLQERIDGFNNDEDAKRLPTNWGSSELLIIYGRLEAMRRFVEGFDQPTVAVLVKSLIGELAPADREVLVRAVKGTSALDARALRTDDQVTRWLSVLRYVQPMLERQRPGFAQRPQVERRLLELIVNQALIFAPFQLENVAVARTRYNDYAATEQTKFERLVNEELRRL